MNWTQILREKRFRPTCRGKSLTDHLTEQMQNDLYYFEDNAQALRLITKLHYLMTRTACTSPTRFSTR